MRWLAGAVALAVAVTGGTAALAAGLPLTGVNLSGPELNGEKLPGRLNFDYVYPTEAELDRIAGDGMTVIRLPVLWERLQPALDGELDSVELRYLRQLIDAAHRRHLSVIVDAHDYGAYRGQKIGSTGVPNSAFADFWARMASEFAADHDVIFGLMNEPTGISADSWMRSAQAALDAIRRTGARNLVLISGTGWDGAHNFVSGAGYGMPNAAVMGQLRDPGGAMATEVHQYLDNDFSGTHPECPQAAHATDLLQPFTAWLRANGQRGFLGEFGVSTRPECLAGLSAMLGYIRTNADVWLGWTYFAAGPWWSPDYMFSVEPRNGREREQNKILRMFQK